ncbi:MAG TPA: hypothetical protein PLW14_09150 [Chlorobiota bacterium]|nr:hypothetical protein [Chlorobiota bacterium]
MARVHSKEFERAKAIVAEVNCNRFPYFRLWHRCYKRAGFVSPMAFRLAAKRGQPKAVMAAAREIARINREYAKAVEEMEDAA